MIRIGLRAPVHRMLEALARVCVRAKKAERELAESNLVLGSLSTMIDGGIAAREKLVAEVEQLRAELERVKSERAWTTPEDRNG